MEKDTFYFSHDYNARQDSKIKKLISVKGFAGYGLFWAIIEDLYNNANALPTDYETIAFDLRTDSETIRSVVNDFGLFVVEGDFFGSLSAEKRINRRNEKSKKAAESANARWGKAKSDANALRLDNERNAESENRNAIKETKVNETKGQENKKNERTGNEIKENESKRESEWVKV